jgi:hypothetical protein
MRPIDIIRRLTFGRREEALPQSSVKRAMAAAYDESYQSTCLSRYDLFVG